MIRPPAQHNHQAKYNQPDQREHLDAGEPELDLAEESDAEVVDRDDGEKEYRDPDPRVHRVPIYPVLNHERACRQLVGRGYYVFEPVYVACREA